MRRRNQIFIVVLAILGVIGVGFVVWAETPLGPMSEAVNALKSDSSIVVTVGEWLIFQPSDAANNVGYVIYPGGRVDYRSYSPVAHALASEGYLVVIVHMPLNLAVLGADSAQKVIDAFPGVGSWAVGGHSLGGTMAAQYASHAPPMVKGLVLWASYPASGNDLSRRGISVATIHGVLDGLVSSAQIDESMKMLPIDTIRVEIEGGNHAQFGWYGPQPGDNEATINREAQQARVVESTLQLLKRIG